ncbi:hypothetical protein D3C78_946320 [compost metagenome]
MGIEVIHRFFGEQRGVGGHDEFDELARLAKTLLTIVDHVLDQLAVAQRFAAEEHHGETLFVRGFAQQHFHRGDRRFDVHFLARRRLVEVFLVAIRAAQVAAGVDVEHHGIDRRALDPFGGDVRGQRRAVADQFQGHQLAQGLGDFLAVETRGQALDQVVRGTTWPAQGIDDGTRQFIAGEQRTAGDVKQHAVGIDLHFVQVAFDQIQDSAHCQPPVQAPLGGACGHSEKYLNR